MNKFFIGDKALSPEITKKFGGKAQKLHELFSQTVEIQHFKTKNINHKTSAEAVFIKLERCRQ